LLATSAAGRIYVKKGKNGESLTAASSKTARFENRIAMRKPVRPIHASGVMMSEKNAHPNLLHAGPALVSSNRRTAIPLSRDACVIGKWCLCQKSCYQFVRLSTGVF
jgi:hypothetical protein